MVIRRAVSRWENGACTRFGFLNKKQKKRIRGFIGGNRKNEIRNRYYETDFINVHISC